MSEEEKNNQQADKKRDKGDDVELITLTEVSERTGISMPTLQRYKKEFQDRLPSVGEGRTQKYRADSLEIFEQIKRENIKKRGRPKKSRKKKTKKKSSGDTRSDLLTLTEVSERTGISYPTLVRYVKLHGDRIPFEGEGRRRRYHPEAVEVFQEIRSQSGRGRRKKSSGSGGGGGKASPDLARRVKALEKSQERLEKQIKDLLKELRKPLQVTLRRG